MMCDLSIQSGAAVVRHLRNISLLEPILLNIIFDEADVRKNQNLSLILECSAVASSPKQSLRQLAFYLIFEVIGIILVLLLRIGFSILEADFLNSGRFFLNKFNRKNHRARKSKSKRYLESSPQLGSTLICDAFNDIVVRQAIAASSSAQAGHIEFRSETSHSDKSSADQTSSTMFSDSLYEDVSSIFTASDEDPELPPDLFRISVSILEAAHFLNSGGLFLNKFSIEKHSSRSSKRALESYRLICNAPSNNIRVRPVRHAIAASSSSQAGHIEFQSETSHGSESSAGQTSSTTFYDSLYEDVSSIFAASDQDPDLMPEPEQLPVNGNYHKSGKEISSSIKIAKPIPPKGQYVSKIIKSWGIKIRSDSGDFCDIQNHDGNQDLKTPREKGWEIIL